MDRALNFIGIAKKAGALEIGEENSGSVVRSGKVPVLLLAADASDNAERRAKGFVYGSKTILLRIPYTKEQISALTGKNGCSMAAVTDIGLAAGMVEALAADYPDRYSVASDELKKRKERVMQRRQEAKAHQKNLKLGKRRTKV